MGEWLVIELSSRCEGEDPRVLQEALTRLVKTSEVFVPAAVTEIGDDVVYSYLLEGYAFVRRDSPDSTYLRLENSRYVESVLTEPRGSGGSRRLSTVSEEDIDRFRRQVKAISDQGISVGDTVTITSGPYRNIEATVVEDIAEEGMVQVHVKLRSKQSLVTLPRGFLRVVKRAPLSPVYNRMASLRAWSTMATALLEWEEGDWSQVQAAYDRYHRLHQWSNKGRLLYSFLGSKGILDHSYRDLQRRLQRLSRVKAAARKASRICNLIAFSRGWAGPRDLESLQNKLMDLAWLDDVMRRVQELHRSYNVLNRRLTHRNEKRKMVQNVLIDGHNLAFRCMYAPGMSRLSDSQGRPTGLIVGFLRSLGALRKKYPTARFWVTWDGSSQRRKSSFADYKANRPVREADESGFDQMAYVRKVIVYLGVTQAFNPEEEADDVIGALVKGDLVSQKNVIFSSDKDLLQLVTHDTFLLIPAIGSRKEILFEGPEIVEEYMGVPPGKMVEFRALCGDPSDNIPGVPRVPKKVLRALIQAHGSVDGIYKSGLAGLTRNQYDRLRSAEPQVRINLELMALVDVEVSLTYPDVNSSVAQQLMEEVGIKPQPILKAFGL